MTSTHWLIYNYIKENSEKDKWTKQIEIQKYLLEEKNFQICMRDIRRKINEIRRDEVIQKVILTDYSKGYRIMSDDEEKEYLINRKVSILKMLKLCYQDIRRYNMNNQCKIAFTDTERNIYESLLKKENKEAKNEQSG